MAPVGSLASHRTGATVVAVWSRASTGTQRQRASLVAIVPFGGLVLIIKARLAVDASSGGVGWLSCPPEVEATP